MLEIVGILISVITMVKRIKTNGFLKVLWVILGLAIYYGVRVGVEFGILYLGYAVIGDQILDYGLIVSLISIAISLGVLIWVDTFLEDIREKMERKKNSERNSVIEIKKDYWEGNVVKINLDENMSKITKNQSSIQNNASVYINFEYEGKIFEFFKYDDYDFLSKRIEINLSVFSSDDGLIEIEINDSKDEVSAKILLNRHEIISEKLSRRQKMDGI